VNTGVDDRAFARGVACGVLMGRRMRETRPRKKLVLTSEVLRTLVVGGSAQQGAPIGDRKTLQLDCAAKAVESRLPRWSQFDSCGIVCGITRGGVQ
jgi:phosphohistidine phosphatase SixA